MRAMRGRSDVCVALLGRNAIGDISNARIVQWLLAIYGAMASRGTTLLFCEIPYRATNRYGIIIIICHPIFILQGR